MQPTNNAANVIAETSSNASRRASSESLLGSDIEDAATRPAEIPAASAIAGRVSASQELPYMTPPIVQPAQAQPQPMHAPPPQLHFSGDSQDSSKGYTSISVREPLANILAQTKSAQQQSLQQRKFQDSHYATVSDDSDEMYAAIEDPNAPGELYTSGSETYAQIQPMVVNVEVNTPTTTTTTTTPGTVNHSPGALPGLMERSSSPQTMTTSTTSTELPSVIATLPPVAHSRQASSSSSIGGILGSPKPEKRQANSPLPPTPKGNSAGKVIGHYLSNTTLNSGRNSVASSYNVDFSPSRKDQPAGDAGTREVGVEGGAAVAKKKSSPSKDLEGMYAKVMKKNKLSNVPSENCSPVFGRRMAGELDIGETSSENSISAANLSGSSREGSAEKPSAAPEQNNYETIERKTVTRRVRDPGYETIPAAAGEKCRRDLLDSLNAAQPELSVTGKVRNSAPAGEWMFVDFVLKICYRVL